MRGGGRRLLAAGLVAGVLAVAGCTGGRGTGEPGSSSGYGPGAAGVGDPYYPDSGNGGYDVGHYDLAVTYDPASDTLTGEVTITATATADLSRFDLDLSGLDVDGVTVDGTAVGVDRDGDELIVSPERGLPDGEEFTVTVRYGGVPEPVRHPQLGDNGFSHTDDGAFVIGQPQSATTWFPVNDHPLDKATYTIEITVPDGLAAVSNGVPEGRTSTDGWTTWRWAEDTPMASYQVALAIGDYRVETGEHDRRPMVVAVHESLPAGVDDQLRRTGEIADFLATQFGPYPFESYGGVALADERIGFALETQTRPIYGPTFFRGGVDASWVIVHEVAHQWYGDSVSVRHWNDIWLNEGFATYAEWLWDEHTGRATAQQTFDRAYDGADRGLWAVPPGDPGPANLFHFSVYRRGAMTLHALRTTVGDDEFFRILRTWSAEKRNGNATTAEFVTVAERVSGRSLRPLFDAWLYGTERPDRPGR